MYFQRVVHGRVPFRTEKPLSGIAWGEMPQCFPTRGGVSDSFGDFATVFRISDTIRRTTTEDGGILLDIHHGQMFSLNIVGARIIELLENGFDEAQITAKVSEYYATDIDRVRADVHEFIEVLKQHHILQIRSESVTG